MALLSSLIYGDGIRGTITKTVFVASASDFPAPVSGVHTLEDNTLYSLSGTVDLNGNRIIGGQNSVIVGTSSESTNLRSTGLTGTALITSEWSLPMRNISITADIAVDLDADGNANQALDWLAVNFLNCGQVGTIANYSNFIYNFSAILSSGGMTIDGSIGTVGITNSLLQSNGNNSTLLNIPSTTTITRRVRISDSAFVVLSGDTGTNISNSATIPVEGVIMDGVNFSGSGTYNAGVQYDDNKAWFRESRGVMNSSEVGQYTMNGNSTATTISSVDTPVKVAGITSASLFNQKFSHSNNRLTYTGALARSFKVLAILSATSANGNQVGMYIAKNGVVIDESETYITTGSSGRLENGTVQTIIEMTTNDYIEVFVENSTGANNITVSDLNVTIEAS